MNKRMKTFKFLLPLLMVATVVFTSCEKTEEDFSVKGITLDKPALNLKPGAEEVLTFTIYPANAANKAVTWSSDNEAVATVSADGKVSAVKPGNAAITVTTVDRNETATCSVVVSLNDPITTSGNVEGVWPKYSIVNVTGHLNIPAGKSLTIEEGVEVIVSDAAVDASGTKIEIIVNGNLYSKGTAEAPVLFSVTPAKRTSANAFARFWGGIIGSATCGAMLLQHTTVEYTGAVTTVNSPSVTAGLFKPAGGEAMVAFNTNNPAGKYVVQNCTFRYTGEDAIYVQGGDCIFSNNTFYANGEAGGEAINVKAGCTVDAAFNLMYSPNTNALKLSSSGQDPTRHQALIKGYNNTIINAGWRRDPNKPKGGSVWLEMGCLVEIYNNLIVNSMFAVRQDGANLPDDNSQVNHNFYASGTQQSSVSQHIANGTVTAFDGFKAGVQNIVIGANDKVGQSAGDNDPRFVDFPYTTNPLLSYDNFSASWNFHLQAGSPALTGAKTDFEPYFAATGITIAGKEYKSPRPASYFGAFGAN
ncbi:hypothetical protein FACS189413_13000 [Bacteroidia bacterium]|nr:hypothetical protein FACS189413_13000 [Bacteroidia bacterium]